MPHIVFGTYLFLVPESVFFFYEEYKSNQNSVVNKMLFLLVPFTIWSICPELHSVRCMSMLLKILTIKILKCPLNLTAQRGKTVTTNLKTRQQHIRLLYC